MEIQSIELFLSGHCDMTGGMVLERLQVSHHMVTQLKL